MQPTNIFQVEPGVRFLYEPDDRGRPQYVVVQWDTGETASWTVGDFLTDAGAANDALRKLMKRRKP